MTKKGYMPSDRHSRLGDIAKVHWIIWKLLWAAAQQGLKSKGKEFRNHNSLVFKDANVTHSRECWKYPYSKRNAATVELSHFPSINFPSNLNCMLLYCILNNTQDPRISQDWKVTVNIAYNKAWEGNCKKSYFRSLHEICFRSQACKTGPY